MAGETDLAKERLDQVDKILDEYEDGVGLPGISQPGTANEFEKYMTMDRKAIEALSGQDCAQIAARLVQFSFYIQRLLNREQARVNVTAEALDNTLAPHVVQFDKWLKNEIKVAMAIKQNEYAKSLQKILNHARQRVTRLTYLGASIKNLADVMLANQRAKYSVEKNNE